MSQAGSPKNSPKSSPKAKDSPAPADFKPAPRYAKAEDYDADNIFAKILNGDVPSYKVFENRFCVAILDAFPIVEGHVLVIPKQRGYKSVLEMPPRLVSDVTQSLPIIAKAMTETFKCEGINIVSNNGEAAGQTVFHPHFHLIPRYASEKEKLIKFPPSSGKIDEAKANEIKDKLAKTLEDNKPLPQPRTEKKEQPKKGESKKEEKGKGKKKKGEKEDEAAEGSGKKSRRRGRGNKSEKTEGGESEPKEKKPSRAEQKQAQAEKALAEPTYLSVGDLQPDGNGFSIVVKVVGAPKENPDVVTRSKDPVLDAQVGDSSGVVNLSMKKSQLEALGGEAVFKKDAVFDVKNCYINMKGGFMRCIVDKFGEIEKSDKKVGGVKVDHNMSLIEYELTKDN